MMEKREWFRREDEPQKAYEAFLWYLYLPSESRSIDAAYALAHPQQTTSKRQAGRWFLYSSKYSWVTRAQVYDDHLSARSFFLQEESIKKHSEARARRAEYLETKEHEMSGKLFDLAKELLNKPMTKVVADKDGKTIHIYPAKWTVLSIAKVLDTASKLGRLSAGLPSDVRSVDVIGTLNDITDLILDAVKTEGGEEIYRRVAKSIEDRQRGQ